MAAMALPETVAEENERHFDLRARTRVMRAELTRDLQLMANAARFMPADELRTLLEPFLEGVRQYIEAEAFADRGASHAADTDRPPAPKVTTCPKCRGAGFVEVDAPPPIRETLTCPKCYGAGCIE